MGTGFLQFTSYRLYILNRKKGGKERHACEVIDFICKKEIILFVRQCCHEDLK